MDNTTLKAQIDSQITNETTPAGITPTEVGTNMKSIVDYVDQENAVYIAKLTQVASGGIIETVVKNTITGITVGYAVQSTGTYGISPSDAGNYIALISNTSLTKTVKVPMNFSGFSGVFTQTDLSGTLVDDFDEIYLKLIPNN